MELHFTKGSRARGIALLTIVIMSIFVIRLFYIQIIRHETYVAQADSEHIKPFILHAKRGLIYAMDGANPTDQPIVMNETVYTVWADPTLVQDKSEVVSALNSIAGGNVRDKFAKYLDVKNSRYQVLATKVSRTQAELLKKKNLAGIGFDGVSQRVYPEGQLASQVLGFVNAEGKGVYGFEQANDSDLKGKDGLLKTVTDIRSVPLTVTDKNIRKPAVDGKNMVLSIDRNIQAQTEQVLADGVKRSGADHASAIVMDPKTGKVLAMANVPTYDPSKLNEVTDIAALNNDTISNPYEPGSDIKTFTVATGVDKGVITPESTYNNTDQISVDDITISNASKGHTGNITMQTALNWSLNTGMVTVAERLGDGNYITRGARDTMYDYFYNRFRLGKMTGIELANEQTGTIISPKDVQGNAVRYSNMSFGQGMDATMLQVASGFCALVNGGTYFAPSVIAGTMSSSGVFTKAPAREQYNGIVSPSTSATVAEMVHQSHYATYNPHDGSENYFIGGKTGTSQTIVNGKYVNDQTIGTYLGFGGQSANDVRYVIMIEISAKNHSMGGGADAKPIFNALSNWMIPYLSLTPKA
ncbi:MAG: penicillin-binding protein 2 [Candidatus Saccharimonas sp.]